MDIRAMLKCTRCGRCRIECPTQDILEWESANPRGRIILTRGLTESGNPTSVYERSIFTCTTCGTCTQVCPSAISAEKITRDARAWFNSNKPLKHQTDLRERIIRFGNSLGESDGRWKGGSGQARAVYFAGCLASYRQRKIAEDTFSVLRGLGVGTLADEYCCGSPLLRLGIEPPTIEHNLDQINQSGAETVITGCAGCYNTLRSDYPRDAGFEVVHSTEYIADNLSELDILRLDLAVTYHDPCHISRHHGVTDAPRAIIREIATLVEMPRNRGDARCCGGGGGVRLFNNEVAQSIAKSRLQDVPKDVEWIVTSCPMCYTNLKDAGGHVIDIAELLCMAMK